MPDPSPPALPPSLGSTSPARSPVSEPSRVSRHLLQVSALCGRQVAPAPGASGTPLTMSATPQFVWGHVCFAHTSAGAQASGGNRQACCPRRVPGPGLPRRPIWTRVLTSVRYDPSLGSFRQHAAAVLTLLKVRVPQGCHWAKTRGCRPPGGSAGP